MTEFGTVTQMGRSIYWRGQPRRHRKGAAAAYSSWRSSVKFYAEGITDLSVEALDVIFQALVLSKVTYALQAFAGHISVTDRNRLDKFFRKSHCRGLVNQVFNISSLIDRFHSQLFRSTAYPDHCLHDLLRST